jgi:hypothetical protein
MTEAFPGRTVFELQLKKAMVLDLWQGADDRDRPEPLDVAGMIPHVGTSLCPGLESIIAQNKAISVPIG